MSILREHRRPTSIQPCLDLEMQHGNRFPRSSFISNQCTKNGRISSSSSSISDDFLSLSSLTPKNQDANSVGQTKDNDAQTLELLHRTRYPLSQKNGQRIYGNPPPNWTGPPPTKGTEIFVGKVPRDMYEWELVPIFESCGTIYELRLMMDFSGSNRGYLFVRYANRDEAKRAIKELNNYEIRPGKFIGVIPSVDNRKLWISGIPKDRSAEEIRDEMSKLTDGVTNVYIYSSHLDKSKTRGYAFVEYLTHRHAALARRKLVPGKNFLFDQEIERVDWAEPENEVDDEIMSKVKILFIRNLSGKTSEDEISAVFEAVADGKVERVKKAKDYAFVHFQTREAAEKAFEETKDNLILNNCQIEVSWSKPIDRQIHNQRKQLTKALTSGQMEPNPVIPVDQKMPPPPLMMNPLGSHFRPQPLIAPRPGGAAGIRGLGAPGTPPPRSLIRKLNNAVNGNSYQSMYEEVCEQLMKNRILMNSAEQFAGPNFPDFPMGPPSSPPPTGGILNNHFARMMFPPPPNSSPFFFYNAGI